MDEKKVLKIKKKKELLNILIAGYFFIAIGIFSIFYANYFGILFILAGLLVVTYKKGELIDFENKQIIHYKTIAFYTFKKFEDISNIKYVAMVRVRLSQVMNVATISGMVNYDEMQVKINLITVDKKVVSIITDLRKNIFPLAEKIAKGLNVNLFDNSEGKKVWIEY